MRRIIAGALAVLMSVSGCASYTPTSAPLAKGAGAMPACSTEGPLTMGADPFVKPERQKETFGGNVGAAGVLPIQVFFQYNGEKRVFLRPSEMVLVLPDGSQLSPASSSAAAARMESVGGVVVAAIGFGLVGALVASSVEEKARAARHEDYRRKELRETSLGKGDSVSGFVYFIPPATVGPFNTATLKTQSFDMEDASCTNLEVTLKDLKYDPPKPAALEDFKTGYGHN